ncbi:hypothetical protein ACFQH6_15060 [Halobacteriaceae archaeon GCM10025711]
MSADSLNTGENSQQADPDTLLEPGQEKAVRAAIKYCRLVNPTLADYQRLLDKINREQVLSKRDRRRLQDILNKHAEQRLTPDERRINAWARSELWDAHRPRTNQ